MAKKARKNPADQTRSQAKRSTEARKTADHTLSMRLGALEQRVHRLEDAAPASAKRTVLDRRRAPRK